MIYEWIISNIQPNHGLKLHEVMEWSHPFLPTISEDYTFYHAIIHSMYTVCLKGSNDLALEYNTSFTHLVMNEGVFKYFSKIDNIEESPGENMIGRFTIERVIECDEDKIYVFSKDHSAYSVVNIVIG